jgi:hypothetical protein
MTHRRADHISPLRLAGGDVEKTYNPARPGCVQHLLLPLGEAGIVEVAMAID